MAQTRGFYFTGDDYSYRIEIEAKRRYLQLLKDRFNSGIRYKGRALKWDTAMLQKTMELARYLAGKSRVFDLSEPKSGLDRTDGLERTQKLFVCEVRETG